MGFVSLTMIVNTGMEAAPGATCMKPDRKPVTLGIILLIGVQGSENADCTTEWFSIKSDTAVKG
jgi:hypothetical protein